MAVDNGRLIESRGPRYLAFSVYLGSELAATSVRRLLKAGVSPNAAFPSSALPWHGDDPGRPWCSCALEQAARHHDVSMLKILIDAGASPTSQFYRKYGNVLISIAAEDHQPGRQTSCLRCVELLIDSGVKFDSIPKRREASTSTTKTLGWNGPGKPKFLIDRLFLSSHGESREVHKCIVSHSEWWKNCVTVSGVFQAAEGGPHEVQGYLDSMAMPDATGKTLLLQIALSEAARRNAVTVVLCLAQFGVDVNVEFLITTVPEDQRRLWRPVLRAAASWNPKALAILLEHGASYQPGIFEAVVDRQVNPASDYKTLQEERNIVLQILLDADFHVDVPPEKLLLAALMPVRLDGIGEKNISESELGHYCAYMAEFQPDFLLCNNLKQHGISSDLETDGVNTLQMALRAGCVFSTADFLIRSGVQVHSIPHQSHWTYQGARVGDTTMLHDALIHWPRILMKSYVARVRGFRGSLFSSQG